MPIASNWVIHMHSEENSPPQFFVFYFYILLVNFTFNLLLSSFSLFLICHVFQFFIFYCFQDFSTRKEMFSVFFFFAQRVSWACFYNSYFLVSLKEFFLIEKVVLMPFQKSSSLCGLFSSLSFLISVTCQMKLDCKDPLQLWNCRTL